MVHTILADLVRSAASPWKWPSSTGWKTATCSCQGLNDLKTLGQERAYQSHQSCQGFRVKPLPKKMACSGTMEPTTGYRARRPQWQFWSTQHDAARRSTLIRSTPQFRHGRHGVLMQCAQARGWSRSFDMPDSRRHDGVKASLFHSSGDAGVKIWHGMGNSIPFFLP